MEPHNEVKRSWFSRNKRWALPTGGCLVIVVLAIVFITSLISGVTSLFTRSEPFLYAFEQAQQSEWVDSRLGAPIEVEGTASGSLNFEDGGGTAQLSIPVKGTKDEGTIFVIATKTAEVWVYDKLTITINDSNEVYDLINKQVLTTQQE